MPSSRPQPAVRGPCSSGIVSRPQGPSGSATRWGSSSRPQGPWGPFTVEDHRPPRPRGAPQGDRVDTQGPRGPRPPGPPWPPRRAGQRRRARPPGPGPAALLRRRARTGVDGPPAAPSAGRPGARARGPAHPGVSPRRGVPRRPAAPGYGRRPRPSPDPARVSPRRRGVGSRPPWSTRNAPLEGGAGEDDAARADAQLTISAAASPPRPASARPERAPGDPARGAEAASRPSAAPQGSLVRARVRHPEAVLARARGGGASAASPASRTRRGGASRIGLGEGGKDGGWGAIGRGPAFVTPKGALSRRPGGAPPERLRPGGVPTTEARASRRRRRKARSAQPN